jgi:phenylalanyl-tRNA synthetase beta chain
VLLESAHFAPRGILRTARRLGLVTEASVRFSRGADPEGVEVASARAARLTAEWGKGTVLQGFVEAGGSVPPKVVGIRPARASLVLGYPVSRPEAIEALRRLHMDEIQVRDDETLEVLVPSHRWDLELEEDLIEEVARIQGYDRVPETLPPVRGVGGVPGSSVLRRRVREALVRAGLREALSYSFATAEDLELTGDPVERAVRVANPLAADQAYLRTSLLPGLVRSLRSNLARSARGAALFEVGHVFRTGEASSGGATSREDPTRAADPSSTEGAVLERESVAFVMGGAALPAFPGEGRDLDFFDAKGAVEALLDVLGVSGWSLGEPASLPFHPGRSGIVLVGDRRAGVVGQVHPRVAEQLDLPAATFAAEFGLGVLGAARVQEFRYRGVPRFPPVRRDLAFVVRDDVSAGTVEDALRAAGGDLVSDVALFDVFVGDPVPAGARSLAFSIEFRSPERTLTDQEVDAAVDAIAFALRERLGAELRRG